MTTFYLKYRPQKFQDLDSLAAKEELEKIFSSGHIPHAFLFSGPRGIGKTSAARIVAKAVNCEQANSLQTTDFSKEAAVDSRQKAIDGKPYEPCNQCDSCISITKGTNVDVLEIDAASNRGIDDIKELRDKIKLAPAAAKYKVYIIDEVHMLTSEAFNALLKTLEEPPKHAIFVLCTTDPEKLPKTIISRCQRINFKRATKKEMVERLKRICAEEKLEAEDKALEEIAKLADGSFRDANKILEQISLSGKVTAAMVEKSAGIFVGFGVEDFLLLLQERQTKETLLWIGKATEEGLNWKNFLEQLLEELRLLLLSCFGVAGEEWETKFTFSIEEIKELISLFTRAHQELRTAVIPQLPLEMAVIEWEGDKGEGEKCDLGREVRVGSEGEKEKNPSPLPSSRLISHISPPLKFSLEDIVSKWPLILEAVKPLNHSVLAFLRATRPLAYENGFLTLEVFYKFHKDQLESEKCRRILEKAAGEVLGSEVKIKCRLSEKEHPLVPPPSSLPPVIDEPVLKKVAKAAEDDIIKMAEEIFNNNIQQ